MTAVKKTSLFIVFLLFTSLLHASELQVKVIQSAPWISVDKVRLITDATIPYALTNPVFVDVDGNGKFDPPLLKKIESVSKILGLKPITR